MSGSASEKNPVRGGPPLLAVHLFHGRKDPDMDMDDWGEDGPCIGPFHWFHTTYDCHVRAGRADPPYTTWEITDSMHGDMIYYDGMFYGDWSVCDIHTFLRERREIVELDEAKAKLPEGMKTTRGMIQLTDEDKACPTEALTQVLMPIRVQMIRARHRMHEVRFRNSEETKGYLERLWRQMSRIEATLEAIHFATPPPPQPGSTSTATPIINEEDHE